MIFQAGFWWPEGEEANGGIPGLAPDLWVAQQTAAAMRYVQLLPSTQRHTAVCAGGHIGIMPRVYGAHFEHVIVFEPDEKNWECLLANMQPYGYPVKLVNAALMHKNGSASIIHNQTNSGASFLEPVTNPSRVGRPVDCVMLDYIALVACDLLQLDVEGCELQALEGAADTIYKHRPIIVLELNACVKRYGYDHSAIYQWLGSRGYVEKRDAQQGNDHVFIHQ